MVEVSGKQVFIIAVMMIATYTFTGIIYPDTVDNNYSQVLTSWNLNPEIVPFFMDFPTWIQIQFMQSCSSSKSQVLTQNPIIKDLHQHTTNYQVLFNLEVFLPWSLILPPGDIWFWNHRSLSRSMLMSTFQGLETAPGFCPGFGLSNTGKNLNNLR